MILSLHHSKHLIFGELQALWLVLMRLLEDIMINKKLVETTTVEQETVGPRKSVQDENKGVTTCNVSHDRTLRFF